MSARVSGLSDAHAASARKTILHGVDLLIASPSKVHYTQGPQRWQGIVKELHIAAGHCITEGDCSSTATWLLWNALHVAFGVHDIVNGENWHAGYTGTIAVHGKRVLHDHNIKVGDLILYGPAPTFEHVAISIGGRRVCSHGGEAGPFLLDLDYRGDRGPTRRFI